MTALVFLTAYINRVAVEGDGAVTLVEPTVGICKVDGSVCDFRRDGGIGYSDDISSCQFKGRHIAVDLLHFQRGGDQSVHKGFVRRLVIPYLLGDFVGFIGV